MSSVAETTDEYSRYLNGEDAQYPPILRQPVRSSTARFLASWVRPSWPFCRLGPLTHEIFRFRIFLYPSLCNV